MFIDARSLDENSVIHTGICIIGAGAAGITLALSLRSARFPIAILESGDLVFDEATRDLNAGEITGLPIFPLEISRLRFFGGSTNHWGGTCRPLDEADFQTRPAIPHSGWPLRRSDLLPYYAQAHRLCELGPFEYDPGFWSREIGLPTPKFDPARLATAIFQSSPPTRFGQLYRDDLRHAEAITVYLNANAVDLQPNATASAVERVKVASLGGPAFFMSAKYVVLATGGLENARLLLLSNGIQSAGLGNTNDLVGRYFMEHPYFRRAGVARFAAPDPPLPYAEAPPAIPAFAVLGPGDTLSSQAPSDVEGTGGFQIMLREIHRSVDGVDSLKTVADALSNFTLPPRLWHELGDILRDRGEVADSIYRTITGRKRSSMSTPPPRGPAVTGAVLDMLIEQAPNPDSRVTLSRERDALGQNRLALDWRLGEFERRTYRRAPELAGLEFGRLGIGRVRATALPKGGWPKDMDGSDHHMGTTRMSDDPKTGVVDADCRVHGVANLYIAGSSVFPTSGYANPTLTIVALAARLGDELRRRMA
ncbi:MAG: GMC family oxidoreductase [Acetobacteraceae bacterium]|nr:GMC family oxidoreductase [Acetobacteraceae bacterium]